MLMGNMGLYRNGATFGQAFVGVLDLLSTPSTAAFSLRKLRSDYTGNAIRVRRSNDNAETDIGFTSAGDLDQSALLAFVGENSAFITTCYDQSGNGRNVVQATAARQPRIVNGGVIDKVNGLPTVRFLGAQFLASSAPNITYTGILTSIVGRQASTGTMAYSGQWHGTSPRAWLMIDVATDAGVRFTINSNSPMVLSPSRTQPTPMSVMQGYQFGTEVRAYRNGISGTAATSVLPPQNGLTEPLCLGAERPTSGAASYLNGWLSEVVLFSSQVIESDRLTLQQNQGVYYGITIN